MSEASDKRIKVLETLPRIAPHCERLRVYLDDQDREVEMRLLPEDAGEGAWEVFEQELRELLRIDHPSYLPVLETGSSRGRAFYLVPARGYEPLAKRRHDPDFSVEERCMAVRALAAALAEAHARGLVLGPLSPVTLAWEAPRSRVVFAHHRVSPEVKALPLTSGCPGGLAEPRPGNDVFHWAYLAYWLITRGKLPYKDSGPPRRLREVVPSLAPDLAEVIDASLAPDRSLRPAHGVEVLAVLLRRPANRAMPGAQQQDAPETLQLELAELRRKGGEKREGGPSEAGSGSRLGHARLDLVDPEAGMGRSALAVGVGCLLLGGIVSWVASPGPGAASGRVAQGTPSVGHGGAGDPFLQILLRRREVPVEEFPRVWRLATKLAGQGRLPEQGLDLEALARLEREAREDPGRAARHLELWLEDLRAAAGDPP